MGGGRGRYAQDTPPGGQCTATGNPPGTGGLPYMGQGRWVGWSEGKGRLKLGGNQHRKEGMGKI